MQLVIGMAVVAWLRIIECHADSVMKTIVGSLPSKVLGIFIPSWICLCRFL